MFENVKLIFGRAVSTIKGKINVMSKPIKFVITGYFMLVVLLVLTYYAAWLYQSCNGQIIKEMIGPAMIGFMTFIAGCFIDMNNNGIPDRFEEEKVDEKNQPR